MKTQKTQPKKPIYITERNRAALQAVLDEVQGRAKVRTITVDDLFDFCQDAEKELTSHSVLKSHLRGVEVVADPCARKFPNAYKYPPASTQFKSVYGPSGWQLVWVTRDICGTKDRIIHFNDTVERDLLAHFRGYYVAEKPTYTPAIPTATEA